MTVMAYCIIVTTSTKFKKTWNLFLKLILNEYDFNSIAKHNTKQCY